MDLQTALVVAGVFVTAFASLLFVYKFGIKEKSYEEALAEQRQHSIALLGTHAKPKPKDKKPKKAARKLKEKQQQQNAAAAAAITTDTETAEDSENLEGGGVPQKLTHKTHVEFKEPTVEESPIGLPPPLACKRVKREKVRPILVIKDKSASNFVAENVVEVPPANHFEERHPKDEFELLHSADKEDKPDCIREKVKKDEVNKQEAVKVVGGKNKSAESNVKSKCTSEVVDCKQNNNKNSNGVNNKSAGEMEGALKNHASGKNKEVELKGAGKNNSNKKAAKQQELQPEPALAVEKESAEARPAAPQSNGIVTNSGKEKKKKKSEFNTLQQLASDRQGVNLPVLLNLVRKAEMSRSEVQILIDLLLNKQHEAPAVLDEWSEGKSDPVQKLKKQLAEKEKALAEEQEALAGVQAKLREIRAEQTAEKSQLQQRIRSLEETVQAKQLEAQAINGRCHAQTQKLQQLQAQLNEEVMDNRKMHEEHTTSQLQRQQLELRVAQLQEMEALVVQLRNEIQDLSNSSSELHALNEKNMADKEHQQAYIIQLQHQMANYQKDLEQKADFGKKLEEIRLDLERRLEIEVHKENELNQELSRLKNTCQQQADELRRMAHLDVVVSRLQPELQSLQEEKLKFLEEKAQLQAAHASSSVEENKQHKVELLNLHNELASVKSQLQQTRKEYSGELDASKMTISRLQNELDEQRIKNNELRQKNWKVMEALSAAESRNASSVSKPARPTEVVDLNKAVAKAREEEQEANRKLLQRLFPEVGGEINGASPEEFYSRVERLVRGYTAERTRQFESEVKTPSVSPEIDELRAQIAVYKEAMADTKNELNKLHRHIEQEEIGWRGELKAKELEIETLKEQQLEQLQIKLTSLEEKLMASAREKKKLLEELNLLKSKPYDSNNGSMTATIEKLTQEVVQLQEQLFLEQKRNCDITTPLDNNLPVNKAQNHTSTNGSSIMQGNGN